MKEKLQSRFYTTLNGNVRLSRRLNVYAKLLCAELIALANYDEVKAEDEDIAELMGFPLMIIHEALDLLEGNDFIYRTYFETYRIIKITERCF